VGGHNTTGGEAHETVVADSKNGRVHLEEDLVARSNGSLPLDGDILLVAEPQADDEQHGKVAEPST
jgi:hypothetical protein